jgi:hypothetical protein
MPTLTIPELYRSLHEYLLQRIPDDCDSRLTNLVLLMMGIFQSGKVQLNLVARKTPVRAQKLSIVRRFSRWLTNGAVRVRPWYKPFAVELLHAAGSAGTVHLILDTTKVAGNHRLLMVSVAYRRRSLPLAWVWDRGALGHTTTAKQIKLLDYVRQALLPVGSHVSLVGDCEFGNPLLVEYVQLWGWDYALRQSGHYLFMPKGTGAWQRLATYPLQQGDQVWFGNVVLTKTSAQPSHLVLHWAKSEKDPWFLATNQLCPQATLRLYRRRMWIEEMFGDMKGHGFDLESSHLRHFLRLSRLTLAVCLLYLWLIAMAEHVVMTGQTREIDRSDRRDLSIFRLGWDFIERRLALFDPLPDVGLPSFCLLSHPLFSNSCSVSGG